MSDMSEGQPHTSAAHRPDRVAAPVGAREAAAALRNGPIGAYIVASIAAALLFVGWITFYFFLFIPRGPIG
jgi:hypothetical protein